MGSHSYNLNDPFTTETFTINAWIKTDRTQSPESGIVGLGKTDDNNPFINIGGCGTKLCITLRDDSGTLSRYTSGVDYNNGSWMMVTGTFDNSANIMSLWANGVNIGNATAAVGTTTIDFFSIGQIGNSGNFPATPLWLFNGTIDEVGLWDRKLTADEIATQLYNGGDGMTYTNIFALTITTNAPVDNSNFAANNVTFNITAVNTTNPIADVKLFINGELNNTNSSGLNGTYLWDLNFADGVHSWSVGVEDTLNEIANSSLRNFTIDTTHPQIVIQSPNETFNYGKENDNLDFNITVTDTNLDACWYAYNSTNISFSCVTGVKSEEVITQNADNFSVIVYANDTIGNENSTSVNWNYRVFENNLTYNDQVVETSNQDFNISVTHDSSIWNSITSKIEYNGTNYSATQFGTGDTLIFSRTLEIPAITTSTENKSFLLVLYFN